MAKMKNNLVSGTIGPCVFKIVNGKQIVCSKAAPGTMKQTVGTKKAATVFGKAASLEKSLRKTLDVQYADLFTVKTGNEIRARLNSALQSSRLPLTGGFKFDEDSFADLAGLEFNSKSKVRSMLSKLPEVTLNGNVLNVEISKKGIPATIKFPRKTFWCEIVVGVSFFRLEDALLVDLAELQRIVVNKSMTEIEPQTFKFDVPPGTLCVVSLFLNYTISNRAAGRLLKDRTFSPGCFCAAIITPGKYHNSDQRIWRKSIELD